MKFILTKKKKLIKKKKNLVCVRGYGERKDKRGREPSLLVN